MAKLSDLTKLTAQLNAAMVKRDALIVELHAAGERAEAIAAAASITRGRVYQVLQSTRAAAQ
jgi:acetolactate synthase small subunit